MKKLVNEKIGHHSPDKGLLFVIGGIVLFGLLSLSSASAIISYKKFGDPYHDLKHQLIPLTIGLIAFWFFANYDYRKLKKYAFVFLIFSIFLLILVFIPWLSAGHGKSRSWIEIFGQSLQPSEFVKFSFLLYLAAWLEARKKDLHSVNQSLVPFLASLGIIAFLVILQPDVGTLSILGLNALVVYFVAGGKTKHILFILLFAFIGFLVIVQMKEYQKNRIRCVIDPSFDKNGACYQINQSLIAVGSGGFWGRGISGSKQKYMYLPEVSSDFIFAVIAEEVGMFYSIILIGAYIYIFYRGYRISINAPDDFGKILAIGIVSWITIQMMVNIGGIINVIPMTGVPLPLISHGGSAILTALAAMGVLINISKQTTTAN
jgi:cell division protein FtsW